VEIVKAIKGTYNWRLRHRKQEELKPQLGGGGRGIRRLYGSEQGAATNTNGAKRIENKDGASDRLLI
jgi:hypothetical protein